MFLTVFECSACCLHDVLPAGALRASAFSLHGILSAEAVRTSAPLAENHSFVPAFCEGDAIEGGSGSLEFVQSSIIFFPKLPSSVIW